MGMSECLKNAKLIETIKPNWAKLSSFQGFTSAYIVLGGGSVTKSIRKKKQKCFWPPDPGLDACLPHFRVPRKGQSSGPGMRIWAVADHLPHNNSPKALHSKNFFSASQPVLLIGAVFLLGSPSSRP